MMISLRSLSAPSLPRWQRYVDVGTAGQSPNSLDVCSQGVDCFPAADNRDDVVARNAPRNDGIRMRKEIAFLHHSRPVIARGMHFPEEAIQQFIGRAYNPSRPGWNTVPGRSSGGGCNGRWSRDKRSSLAWITWDRWISKSPGTSQRSPGPWQ